MPVVAGDEPEHWCVDDGHTGGAQLVEPRIVGIDAFVQHHRETRCELAEQPGRVQTHPMRDDLDDAPVADLVPVTEGAVDDVATPVLRYTIDVGEHVDQPGRGEYPASDDRSAADELDAEAVVGETVDVDCPPCEDLDAVAADLVATDRCQFRRGQTLVVEVAVHVRSRGITWLARIDDDHRAALPAELQGCGQPGGRAPDDCDVAVPFDET